jgi:acyl-coenzyme A thioesterase PaaI-like protein
MQRFEPVDSDFESRVRHGFSLQRLMTTIAARMTKVAPGEVHIELPFSQELTQQHGYLHGD